MLVVKIGGSLGSETEQIIDDLVLQRSGMGGPVVIVHGGSRGVDALGHRLGLPQRSIVSPGGIESRYTDKETIAVLTMAIAGSLNTDLVVRMIAKGIPAVGLSGVDGAMVVAERKMAIRSLVDGRLSIIRDNYTGTIRFVDSRLLTLLTGSHHVPVVSPPALDLKDGPVNVDADRMAGAIAGALTASCLILLTDRPGLLADSADETSLIGTVRSDAVADVRIHAKGRMKLKLMAAEEALRQGVERVIIASGKAPRPISAALAGGGTHFENMVFSSRGKAAHGE